ncbi:MAG: 50S ribosomal protein L10 [Nanoarchaeota archaeon]
MATKRETPIPEIKKRTVKELVKTFKESPTFLIASIRNLPGGQFQAIKQKLRGTATVKVLKKSLVIRAIEEFGGNLKEIAPFVKEDCALLMSDVDPFELSLFLSKNQSAAKAKIGQAVPEDIRIEPGPTDLVPGPVISELGALGIPIQIKEGKIEIKEAKVILKTGDKVTAAADAIMGKLGIMPFRVGFEPLAAYDSKTGKVYSSIRINSEEALEQLKDANSRALAIAVKFAYPTKETIPFILAKANSQEKALAKLIKSDNQQN